MSIIWRASVLAYTLKGTKLYTIMYISSKEMWLEIQRGTVQYLQEWDEPTWVHPCDETSNYDHGRHPAGPAEAHQKPPNKDQHSSSHQGPFPARTHGHLKQAQSVSQRTITHTDLPYLVTSLLTSMAPIIPPIAKMDTVREYKTVMKFSSGVHP